MRPPFRLRRSLPGHAARGAMLLAAAAGAARAQMHHIEAPEHVTRAIGVYEWTGDLTKPTAARFVPVSLFINGHFEDAGLYLARPVPFALQPGDLYDLERAGEPQGVLDLGMAHRVVTGNAAADGNTEGAWYAFGRFTPHTEPKPHPLHASSHLARLETSAGPNTPAGTKLPAGDSDNDRPHMNRRDNAGSGTPPATPDSGSPSSSGSAPGGTDGGSSGTRSSNNSSGNSSSGSSTDDDVDRPTLRHRDPAQDAARRKEANTRSKSASVTAAGPALGDDPDRPILGHSTAGNADTPELTGLPADLHQAVAVSDAGHTDAHAFDRPWDSPAERAETLAALAALARSRVAAYLTANRLVASGLPLPSAGAPLSAAANARPATSAAQLSASPTENDTPDTTAPPKLQRGIPGTHTSTESAAGSSTRSGSSATRTGSQPTPAATAAGQTSSAAMTASPAGAATAGTLAARSSATRTSATHHPTHRAGGSAAHPATLTLGGEEFAGFTLSYGGLPTFVFSAAASVAPASGPSAASGRAGGSPPFASRTTPAPTTTPVAAQPTAAYVTLVAQRLPSGELQVALARVTDSAHLDRGPQLRLVDAVDPDGSHRASLLLELRGTTSRQFALYRLISAQAEQTFTTASIE